ncbi:MAG: hypothetical protein CML81_00650 [Rhodobiaceae bacterium]|nr:hypothetical protein [Rhodobiaceae bacterium]RPF97885.1 MAG: hypothetical protein CBD87_000645 [Rhizobiales bacterium TMED227]
MNYVNPILAQPEPFKSTMLPEVRRKVSRGHLSKYSKAEQKRIIEHALVHKIRFADLAKHFNVSLATVYNWRSDYMVGMYADEVIYNQTISFRRSY